jgi:hypothetical protein
METNSGRTAVPADQNLRRGTLRPLPQSAPSLAVATADLWQPVRDIILGRLAEGPIRATLSDSHESLLIEPPGRVPPEYLPRMHAHDNYALCWGIAGPCVVEVPDRWVLLDGRTAVLLRTGEAHRIRPTPQ